MNHPQQPKCQCHCHQGSKKFGTEYTLTPKHLKTSYCEACKRGENCEHCDLKLQQQESNMTIELPADAVEILSNGKNAYIHMDGTVYRVIEESKYWEAISTERQRVIEEVIELVETNQKGQFEDDGGNIGWYLDDLLSALKEMGDK